MSSQPLVVDPSQVQSITVDPSAVQPLQPGTNIVGTPFLSGVRDTASKFLKQMNVENLLSHIGQADDLAGQGRWAEAWETLKDVVPGSQDFLGNQQPFQPQKEFVQDTVDKFKQGDYSGGTANLLTVAAMNAHHAPAAVDALGRVTETPRDVVATAAKGAARGAVEAAKTPPGAASEAATTAATLAFGRAGYAAAKGVKAAKVAYGAVQGAREALADRAAQNAMDARVAAQRAAPGPTQAEQAGVTLAPTPQAPSPPVEPIPPDAAALAQQRSARQEINARIVAARQQGATSPTGPAGPSPELLDQIAQAYKQNPRARFARLPAAEQVIVQSLARKVAADEAAKAAAPQVSGPSPVVSPQGAPVPPALPAAPPAPEATPAPAATPVATPSSPEAQALVPTAQSAVSPAATAPPAPAESPSQLTGRMLVIPSAKGTAHVPEGAIEYYPGGGPAHVPTPGEMGFGRYVPEGTAMDSSTLAHIQAENHKAYNAASFAYRQGIRDPSLLDDMTEPEKREFMNGSGDQPGALQHGREVGNPTPKTKYQANRQTGSILDGNTLTLAKAHLQKMLEEGGPRGPEELPAPGEPSGGPSAPPGPAALEAGQAVVKGNLRKSLTDILKDETGSVGKGSGIDPETRKQLIEEASRLGSEVAGRVARGLTTAKEAALRIGEGLRQQFGPAALAPKIVQATRDAIEQTLNDYTRLLPAPKGEPVSPLRAGVQDVSAPGSKKLTAAADFLRRKANRGQEGSPENARIVLRDKDGSFAVGKITPQDWMDRVRSNLSPQELSNARAWYSQLGEFFKKQFGEESAPRMALAWLLGNQNTSPSGAMLNVLRGGDILAGKQMTKTAGLAEAKILQALQGEPVTGGVGAKLKDFVDSALGKTTRTFMGDDPRGGAPAVIDVWANRDVGKVDAPLANYLTKRFGAKAAKLAADGDSIGETDYEYGSQFYNDLAKHLNATGFDGGHWTPAEAQAAGWVAMQKAMGKTAEFPEDIIQKNSRRVSVGLNPAQDTPLRQAGITTIPREHADWMVDRAADLAGVKVLDRHYGTGASLSETQPSMHVQALGSPEAVRDFMDAVGYLGQQPEVIGARPLQGGNRMAVDIVQRIGNDLANDANRVQFHQDLTKAGAPEAMVQAFQPIEVDGRPGLRFVNSKGNWNEKQLAVFETAVQKVAGTKNYDLELSNGKIELQRTGNDWSKDSNGQSYQQGLVDRGRLQEARLLGNQLRPAFAERLRGAQSGDRGSATQGRLEGSPAATAQSTQAGQPSVEPTPQETAAQTVERLRQKKRR